MLNIKYVVNVNWLDFTFDNATQAIYFAKSAMEHIEKNDHTRVSIDLYFVPDEECECECCSDCDCEDCFDCEKGGEEDDEK